MSANNTLYFGFRHGYIEFDELDKDGDMSVTFKEAKDEITYYLSTKQLLAIRDHINKQLEGKQS